jgi:hypothetical protein
MKVYVLGKEKSLAIANLLTVESNMTRIESQSGMSASTSLKAKN